MVPERAPEEQRRLKVVGPSPWNTLPSEVHKDLGRTQINDGETTESPVDWHDQPQNYTIWDHTLEGLMHPSIPELHAVRVVNTPHGEERQLHLKVRVRRGKKEVIADVSVDPGAQVSLVCKGLFLGQFLKPSRRAVRLRVANGKIMGGGSHEATIGIEFWEHDRLNRPDLSKRIVLSGNFYAADIADWDIIMGNDFMVGNAIRALPHRAALVREDKERLTRLSTDHAPGLSQWTGDEEERIVRAVKTMSTKFNGDRGAHLMEYGMAPQVYNRMVQQLGGEKPKTDVFASRDARQLRKCMRHWHKGYSAWSKHWGLKEWGPIYWHGAQEDTRRTVNKLIADGAMGILVVTGIGSSPCPLEDLKPILDSITLNEMQFGPEEQFLITPKGIPMRSPGQAWGTKASWLMIHNANQLVMKHLSGG